MRAVRKTLKLSRALLAAVAQDRQDLGGGGRDVGAGAVDGGDARLLQEVVVLNGFIRRRSRYR